MQKLTTGQDKGFKHQCKAQLQRAHLHNPLKAQGPSPEQGRKSKAGLEQRVSSGHGGTIAPMPS